MKLTQLSLFLENKRGAVQVPCRLLADAKVNIRTLCLADSAEYGVLRLIVPEWQRAKTVLEDAGFAVSVGEVIAIEVPDRPGGLAGLLDLLEQDRLGIVYMYAFTRGSRALHAVMIFRFEDPDRVIAALAKHHINAISPVELFAS